MPRIHVQLTEQTITIPHHKGDEVYAFVVIIMAGVMGTIAHGQVVYSISCSSDSSLQPIEP